MVVHHLLLDRMLRLKDSVRKLIYDDVYDESHLGQSVIAKCILDKYDWESLADIKHALKTFKEGQEIFEISIFPIFIKTIRQELGSIRLGLKDDDKVSPFLKGSNQLNLISLVEGMIAEFEVRWGTGEIGTFLRVNEVRGEAGRQKGMKNTHLMAFMLGPRTKDLTDPISTEYLIEICHYTFRQIVDYAENLNEENNMRNADDERKTIDTVPTATSPRSQTSRIGLRVDLLLVRRILCLPLRVGNQWDMYLRDPGRSLFVNEVDAEAGYNCALVWRREHHVKYPHIWKFSNPVLCIVASSAPSERVFSCGGNIVTNKYCRLSPDTLNTLITLSQNLAVVDWGLQDEKASLGTDKSKKHKAELVSVCK
jgi:hypothetical protein